METVLENELVKVVINHQGAELSSLILKNDNLEFIWQANPEAWARHAPILFPIVGRLKNNEYTYKNKTYSMNQHGFARDMPFELESHTSDSAIFLLKTTDKTRQIYPFEFELRVSYVLKEKAVTVGYEVKTHSDEMYFSIGAHPAFNVPFDKQTTFTDYYLHFSPSKSRFLLPLKNGLIDLNKKTLGQTNTDIQLTHTFFKNDAFILETKGENAFSIQSVKSNHVVKLSYKNFPYVGIWSPYPIEAPFICIEPWMGIADTVESSGELKEKLGINCITPDDVFVASYQINVD